MVQRQEKVQPQASATVTDAVRHPSPDAPSPDATAPVSAGDAAMECFRNYAKERPGTVAMWALGIGFVLGWKLKPW